jgi:hypothetical protein
VKPQIHVSHLRRLATCGEQYRRIYVCGERVPPGVAALVGTATHGVHEEDLRAKMETGKLLDLDRTNSMAAERVDRMFRDGVYLAPAERGQDLKKLRGQAVDRAVRLDVMRHVQLAPGIQPISLSRKWVCTLEGYPYDLAGEFDVEEAGDVLDDLKTSGKYPSKSAADDSMQVTMYGLAKKVCDGREFAKMRLQFLLDIKGRPSKSHPEGGKPTSKVVVMDTVRSPAHYEALLARLVNFMEALQKGVFVPCDPEHWACDPRWCGFFETCAYVRGKVVVGWECET